VRARREHRAEHADDQIEALVGEAGEIAGVALLEAQAGKAARGGPRVAGGDEVGGNVDAEHVCTADGCRQSGGAVAAAEIEHVHARGDLQRRDQRLAALAHRVGDAGEIAFLPQGFVRVHGVRPFFVDARERRRCAWTA
jgi:hypothetical protein